MGFSGNTFAQRWSGRLAEWRTRVTRARFFRGHGVHSPFVYTIVREVFMRRELLPGDKRLYRALVQAGVPQRRAVQLQNLAIHCGYGSFGMNRAEGELCIATCDLSRTETLALVRAAVAARRTVAVMVPYAGCERLAMCRQLVAEHASTTVDNRGYLLIFNNGLPKQHFEL